MDEALKGLLNEVGNKMSTIGKLSQDHRLAGSMKLNVSQIVSENSGGVPGKPSGTPVSTSSIYKVDEVPEYLKPKNFQNLDVAEPNFPEIGISSQPIPQPDDKQMMFDFDKVIKSKDVYELLDKVLLKLKTLEEKIDLILDK